MKKGKPQILADNADPICDIRENLRLCLALWQIRGCYNFSHVRRFAARKYDGQSHSRRVAGTAGRRLDHGFSWRADRSCMDSDRAVFDLEQTFNKCTQTSKNCYSPSTRARLKYLTDHSRHQL